MNALWPVVAMALGLIAVLYAVWPVLRGRTGPLPADDLDADETEAWVVQLERWSAGAGER